MLRLKTKVVSSPFSEQVVVIVVLGSEGLDQGLELSVVLLSDTGDGDGSGGLLADDLSESCLSSDEGEGDFVFSAELRQPEDELNGVDIVSNHDESSSLVLDQSGDVVKSELNRQGSVLLSLLLTGGLGLGLLEESGSLLLGGLGSVLLKESDEGLSLILGHGLGELVEGWGDFESVKEDLLLSLEENVVGPSDESGEVSLGSDVTSDSEVAGGLLEEGVSLDSLRALGDLSSFLLSAFCHC